MKKILCLLLIAILLFLSLGCASEKPSKEDEAEKIYENKSFDTVDSEIGSYYSFEDIAKSSTDIVKATYKGMISSKNYYLLDFEVIDALRGDIENGIMTLCYKPMKITLMDATTPFSYSTKDVPYEIEKDYLLFIERSYTVYVEGYSFELAEPSLVVPLGGDGLPLPTDSKIYGQALMSHISNEGLRLAEGEEFLDKVKSLNNDYSQTSYKTIVVPTADKVVETSPYVLLVRIKAIEEHPSIYYRSLCECNVIGALKGETAADINVSLPTDKIELGKMYVIAVKENDSAIEQNGTLTYIPTTQNSVFVMP